MRRIASRKMLPVVSLFRMGCIEIAILIQRIDGEADQHGDTV